MRHHSRTDQLRQAIVRCERLALEWSGPVYRSASVRYANRDDFLTGSGAKGAGARWNAPGSFATIYTSLAPETATLEALAHHRYFHLPIEQALPRVLASAQVVLRHVLDLTNARIRKSLGVTVSELLEEDWRSANNNGDEALTQAIGRLAWNSEWEGLLVPSAAHRSGTNLIIFPGNLVPPDSYLLIINREQLPPHPAL